jgi:hypothetical protein
LVIGTEKLVVNKWKITPRKSELYKKINVIIAYFGVCSPQYLPRNNFNTPH